MKRALIFLMLSILGWMVSQPIVGCGLTGEGRKAQGVMFWMEWYQSRHDGILPTSWEELNAEPGPQWWVPMVVVRGAEDRYAVLAVPVSLTEGRGGPLAPGTEVVALCRTAIYRNTMGEGIRGPGRYVIYRDLEGDLSFNWMTEAEVAAVFGAAQRDLPGKGGKPMVTEEARSRYRNLSIFWSAYGLAALWAFWPLLNLRVRWWAWTGSEDFLLSWIPALPGRSARTGADAD